jgi:hypothetical protein
MGRTDTRKIGDTLWQASRRTRITRPWPISTLITHIFVPDCPFLAEDTVFGVKDSLIADFVKVDDANQAAAVGLPSPFWSVKWDFVLARTDQVGRSRA